jgi:hypothetical protein
LGSIKDREFLDQLSDDQLVKEDSAPWILLVLIVYIELKAHLIIRADLAHLHDENISKFPVGP